VIYTHTLSVVISSRLWLAINPCKASGQWPGVMGYLEWWGSESDKKKIRFDGGIELEIVDKFDWFRF